MNILILTHSYPDERNPWRGIFVREQAKALSTVHNVTVLYFRTDYSRFAPFSKINFLKKQEGRLTEYELVTGRSFPVINQVKYFADTYRFIKKVIIPEHKPEIINSHFSYPAGFLGTVVQKLLHLPNVTTEHSWIRNHFRSVIHKRCVLYSLKNSAGYIAVSKALSSDIESVYHRDIHILPNVIDTGRFSISGKQHNPRLELGIMGGMGNYRKGLDILIKAVALIKNRNITIHVGGDGVLLEKFKSQARDEGVIENFIFHGSIPAEKTPAFYSALDAYVLASRDETFGVVVIEAMACGLPVIATDCGGPAEIITPETGLLIKKENPGELATAIDYLRENLGKYNKSVISDYARSNFGKEAFVKRMTDVFQTLIPSR